MNTTVKMGGKDIMLYSFAGFGQNIVYALMITYVIDYFTLKLGIYAGIVMLLARVSDALKDPIMGSLMDKTKSKWGKLRPYFIIVPIPLAIMSALLFYIPPMPLILQALYAYVIFFLWGFSYTMGDISYLSAPSTMTDNSQFRVKLVAVARLFCTLGGALPTLLVPLILDKYTDKAAAYSLSAIVFGISGAALFSLAFFPTKEIIQPNIEKLNFKDNFRIIKQNKPLLIVLSAVILGIFRNIIQSIGIIVARVNFGSDTIFVSMALAFGVGLAIGTMIVPSLVKKLDVKKTFIYSNIFAAIVQLIFILIGYQSLAAVIVILFFAGLPFGIYNTLLFSIPVESMDYLEWKTGKRTEGLVFSLQTFTGKVASGILLMTGSLALVVAGYSNDTINSPAVADGLFYIITLVPLVGIILSTIPMLFYDYEGAKKKQILEELKIKRTETI